jgi:hypothetical protein
MTQSKDVVKPVMKRLKIANGPAVGLVADLVEWLVDGQQLVKHVPEVRLLLADSRIHLIIAAGGIGGKSI